MTTATISSPIIRKTRKGNKYTYYRVIQEWAGGEWNDSDWHEADSSYCALNRQAIKNNIKAYRAEGISVRVVNRKELNK